MYTLYINVKPIDSSLCPETNKYLRPTLEKITKRKCLFTARQKYISRIVFVGRFHKNIFIP